MDVALGSKWVCLGKEFGLLFRGRVFTVDRFDDEGLQRVVHLSTDPVAELGPARVHSRTTTRGLAKNFVELKDESLSPLALVEEAEQRAGKSEGGHL